MSELHTSVVDSITSLRERFPGSPFLTLGQTVLWDEPAKAAFCRMLEAVAPDSVMMAAIHDTDYFAKLSHLQDRAAKFAMVTHNDGDTRGLWSAAGEISSLLGAETVPTRSMLTESGVEIDRVARDYPGGQGALLNEETNAWGWRALVQTEPRPLIAADVKLRDIGPALLAQIEWALSESLAVAWPEGKDDEVCEVCATQARENADKVRQWTSEYLAQDPGGTLSDLYRWLTPRLWGLVRNGGSCNLTTSTSLRLFQLNRETATFPRFGFVDLFLQSATRDAARRAYDDAVRGSGIYTLDQFGPGALPFDVVIPGRGRGTLQVLPNKILIATEPAIAIATAAPCASIASLAAALEDKFGPEVALVGKAVSLISMLAQEFIFVFHEKASGYTARTQKMNAALRSAGIELNLRPMLRLRYSTWDSLEQARAVLHLPPHLAAAFGQPKIAAGEFAARWSDVAQAQDDLRAALKSCRSPRELLALLAKRFGGEWPARSAEYNAARATIAALREQTAGLEKEIAELREAAAVAIERAVLLEKAKGEDFRETMRPLRERIFDIKQAQAQRLEASSANDPETGKPRKLTKEERGAAAQQLLDEARDIEELRAQIAECEAERATFDEEIAASRRAARHARAAANAKVQQKVALERSAAVRQARELLSRLRYDAELARLSHVRDAYMSAEALRQTNYRPTAWWFPLVSPDGKWFDRLVETAQAHIEEL